MSRPVAPRNAASLVLLRWEGAGQNYNDAMVLMGRRAPKHAFLPDHYVFPGGRLDRSDYHLPRASNLQPDVAKQVARTCPDVRAEAMAAALGTAAVRETFEETGLMLGDLSDQGKPVAALRHLTYVARAITPPISPIRFHARFFLADAAYADGRLGGSGELLDLHWVPLSMAFALPMADVTEFVLEEVARMLRASAIRTGVPLYAYRNNRPFIRYE
jgi:8-oxo-dGTP pyrophosphatase MutT (NUDIX family)